MQILIPVKMLTSKAQSSYVATQARKKMRVLKGIVPQDKDVFGSIAIQWIQDTDNANIYRLEWKSRLTNSVTTLNKLGSGKFMVSRTSPETSAVNYMFNDPEPAIKAFFFNTDLFRTKDSNTDSARKWCAGHLKRAENLKTLRFNPAQHRKAQQQFDKVISVGEKRNYRAKLLGIDMNGRNVRVKLWNKKTEEFDIEKTIPSNIAWIE